MLYTDIFTKYDSAMDRSLYYIVFCSFFYLMKCNHSVSGEHAEAENCFSCQWIVSSKGLSELLTLTQNESEGNEARVI